MYNQIADNQRKTVLLLGVFLIVLIGLGWVLATIFARPWILALAVVVAVIQAFSSYYYSDKLALAVAGAQLVKSKKDNPYLWRMVENLCITAGVPMPKLYVIPDSAINAFATGRDPKHASMAVTQGALERLENEELEGVIAHELSHVRNYDIRVMTIVVILVGIIVLAADFFMRSLWWSGRGRSDNNDSGQIQAILVIVGIVFAILAPIFAQLLQLAVSRKREYLADASGVLLTRYPEGLAKALEKIAKDPRPMKHANRATAHLYISDPSPKPEDGQPKAQKQGWFATLFATHPPIQDRIKRLRAMA